MGKKFVEFDANGVLCARYDSAVHGSGIPSGAVEVSDKAFRRSIIETDGIWVRGSDADLVKRPFDPPKIDELKAAKLAEVDAAFELNLGELMGTYPMSERLTWPVQQAEALAWKTNPSSSTPYLDSVATARGIDLQDMRQRTLERAERFMAGSAPLLGKRQRLRDEIESAETAEALASIGW